MNLAAFLGVIGIGMLFWSTWLLAMTIEGKSDKPAGIVFILSILILALAVGMASA